MKCGLLFAAIGICSLTACATLKEEPWARAKAGSNTLGFSTGWAIYEAEVKLTDPTGTSGTDTSDLKPNWGGALKYQHFFSDHYALGFIYERRSFDPDPIKPLSVTLDPTDFETNHFLLSNRYWFDPIDHGKRWRPFLGIDLGYVPQVDLDVTARWSELSPSFNDEKQSAKGSSYWTLGFVGGFSCLLTDYMTVDLGAFYEFALNKSKDTLTFSESPPLPGPTNFEAEIDPSGFIGFVGLTFYL